MPPTRQLTARRPGLRAVRARAASVVVLATASLWTVPAAASNGEARPTATVVLLAIAAGAMYLLLKAGLDRVRRRVVWVPGIEHLALGLLLGPVVFGLGVFREPAPIAPFAALAAGWVALSCGTEFNIRALSDPPRGGPRLGVISALLCGSAVAFSAFAVFASGWLGRVEPADGWLTAGWMGCAAAAASTAPLQSLQERFDTADTLPLLLRRSVRFSNLLAIIGFGVLACFFRPGYGLEDRPLSPVELAVLAVGLGAVLGLVLSPYFGRLDSLAGRVLVLTAMVAFATGAATWLGLSPLWVTLAMGAVLVNVSLANERLVEAVQAADPPAVLILLVLAGAFWTPPPLLPALAVTAGFITLRFLGRMLASWLVAKWLAPMRVDTGRGLLGQGAVSIALALAFRISSDGPLVDIGYTAILASALMHDLVAPWALRGLLLDAGELRSPAEAKV